MNYGIKFNSYYSQVCLFIINLPGQIATPYSKSQTYEIVRVRMECTFLAVQLFTRLGLLRQG